MKRVSVSKQMVPHLFAEGMRIRRPDGREIIVEDGIDENEKLIDVEWDDSGFVVFLFAAEEHKEQEVRYRELERNEQAEKEQSEGQGT